MLGMAQKKTVSRHLNIVFVRSLVNASKRLVSQDRFGMSVKVLSKTGESAECSPGSFALIGHFRSHVPLFQNESKCETFHMKMSSACSFIFMQIKVIFIRMVSH